MPDLAGNKIAYVGYCGPIDSAAVGRICNTVNIAVNENYDGVYLNFSSPGGYVGDGVYLYHHLRSLPIPVTIHNTGSVSSIATTIFVAGTTRYCSPNAIFMMHPVSFNGGGSLATLAIQASLEAALHDEERTDAILRERTGIPADVLIRRRSQDVYLSATQALEYGIVSQICDFTLPAGNQIFNI
jgi:ATP-dependent protease ClpP protease subunit